MSSRSRHLLGTLIKLGVVIGLSGTAALGAWQWWQDRAGHVLVYDARLAADMVTLSAAQEGYLQTISVQTGDAVPAGTVIGVQDTRQLDLRIAELDNEIAMVEAERTRVSSERALASAQNESREAMTAAQLSAAEAELRALEAPLERARADLRRAETLYATRTISAQAVETARTDLESAEERAAQGAAAVIENRARLSAARAERGRLAVLDAETEVLASTAVRLETRRAQLLTAREDAEIKVMFDAVVARTYVEAGEYLKPGTRVALVHNPSVVWVEANVKETELHRFRPGAAVDLTLDALPDAAVRGRVRWIGPSATNQFALLPNPNPSGIFTKVTQRVPVRIDFEAPPTELRPGTMVVARIHATQH